MQKPPAWVWVIAVCTVLLSLVLSTLVGAVAGGMAGFHAARIGVFGVGGVQQEQWAWPQEEQTMPWGRTPPVTPQPLWRFEGTRGALVQQVVPGSPAEQCGLQEGDIILAVNDERVGRRLLSDVIGQYKPGDAVGLLVRRGEQQLDFKVRLGENPEDPARGYLGVYVVPYGAPEVPAP